MEGVRRHRRIDRGSIFLKLRNGVVDRLGGGMIIVDRLGGLSLGGRIIVDRLGGGRIIVDRLAIVTISDQRFQRLLDSVNVGWQHY